MTEAVRQVCEAVVSPPPYHLVYSSNTASQRVLERMASFSLQKNAVFKDGKVYDLCLYEADVE